MKTSFSVCKIFLSLLFCFLFSCKSVHSAQVHAIFVGDSSDSTGLFDMVRNVDMMQREAKRIAALNYLPLKVAVFEGFEVRINNLLNYIDRMEVAPDDIILFYANTHGCHAENKGNCWPDLVFSRDVFTDSTFNDLTKITIDFNVINDKLKSKSPRLLLSIADACNSIVPSKNGLSDNDDDDDYNWSNDDDEDDLDDNEAVEDYHPQEFAVLLEALSPKKPTLEYHLDVYDPALIFIRSIEDSEFFKAYQRLFMQQQGNIIASSSVPGEASFGGPECFTYQFIESLNSRIEYKSKADWCWESIFKKVARSVKKVSEQWLTNNGFGHHKKDGEIQTQQTVQYEIEL